MGFMLPYNFIIVSSEKKIAIPATRIVTMMSTKMYQARRTIRDEKRKEKLVNACGNKAAKTAIFLDNGTVISSPLSVPVLINAIENAEIRVDIKKRNKMKIYDIPFDEYTEEETDDGEYEEDVEEELDEDDYDDDEDDE